MAKQEIEIDISGPVNRRDISDKLSKGEVLSRENFLVVGAGAQKQNRKMAGSKRYTTGSVASGIYTWLFRYYSGAMTALFGFKNGKIYHVAPDGTETEKESGLNPAAYPRSEISKVSGANVAYFVDGFNGMYSYDGNIGFEWNKETQVSLNFVYLRSHLDRMWAFEEDSEDLYFSVNLTPTDFTDSSDAGLITIGAKRGSKIMAIEILNEVLYIFKEDSIWVLEGRTPDEFRVRQVHTSLGVAARHSVVNVESGIIFLGSDYEFYSFVGTQASTKILSYNFAIGGDLTKNLIPVINRSQDKLAKVYATFHNHLYRCAMVENGSTDIEIEYIYNTINQTDGLTRGNNVSCYAPFNKAPDTTELVTGRSDSPHVMKQYETLNWDNDSADPKMQYKLISRFVSSGIHNTKFTRLWASVNVLGARDIPVRVQMDTRLADSDSTKEELDGQGETKGLAMLNINNQSSISPKIPLRWSNGRGQSISLGLDNSQLVNQKDVDISISSFFLEAVVNRARKLSKHSGV